MKKVLMLLDNNYIHDNRVKREAKSLLNAGYEVHILCFQYKDSMLPAKELSHGIHIHRIFDPSKISEQCTSLVKLLAFAWHLRKTYGRFDVVHCHDVILLPLGYWLAKFSFARLVYDSHEYWDAWIDYKIKLINITSDFLGQEKSRKKNLSFWKTLQGYQAKILSKSDLVFSVSPSICNKLKEKMGPDKKAVLLRNIPYHHDMRQDVFGKKLFHTHFNLPVETKLFLYQGAIDGTRGLGKIINALDLLQDLPIAFVLMGPINDNRFFQRLMSIAPKGRVFYKEPVYGDSYLKWTASADVGIFAAPNLHDSYYLSLGNKLFEYIQSNTPCLGPNFPDTAQIIQNYGTGLTFDSDSSEDIAQKMRYVIESPAVLEQFRENCSRAKAELCWENEEKRLLEGYQLLCL